MDVVRVGVVGAGAMGANHLRVYSELRGVELVGVYDTTPDRAEKASQRYGCRAFSSLADLAQSVDAVSITASSSAHAEIGEQLLQRGVAFLIEKPLAPTPGECERLLKAAESAAAVLCVGHIERFNPVVMQMQTMLSSETQIYAIDARRLSATSRRIGDVDVIVDLMVHDLDIVRLLNPSPVKSVHASASGLHPGAVDHAIVSLEFENGSVAGLTASRITQNKIRQFQVITESQLIEADLAAQQLRVYHDSEVRMNLESAHSPYRLDLSVEKVLIRYAEPLVRELNHFVDSARRNVVPLISGEDAFETMELLWRVQAAIHGKEG